MKLNGIICALTKEQERLVARKQELESKEGRVEEDVLGNGREFARSHPSCPTLQRCLSYLNGNKAIRMIL